LNSTQFDIHAALEETHWWFTARRRIVRALVETLLPPSQESRIVEVGCGTGGNVADLACDYSCVGVDVSCDAIDRARRRFRVPTFVCGMAPRDIEAELDTAHLVLLLDVLEHVRDDSLLLSQILTAVRPGSYVLLTVPADQTLWTEHDVSFGHFRRYDRRRLEATWKGLAVSCLLCSHFNSRLYAPIKWIRQINRRLGRTSGRAGTDFSQPVRLINRILHSVFSGERHALASALAESRPAPFRHGVSLIAVLRRETSEILQQGCGKLPQVRNVSAPAASVAGRTLLHPEPFLCQRQHSDAWACSAHPASLPTTSSAPAVRPWAAGAG
jgi:SAM-dependent methyltransferase